MLTITDAAKKKILALFEGEEQKDLALRVAIRGRGPGGFRYELQFVGAEERGAEDTVVNAGGFDVLVDPDSAPNLKGATVDFLDGVTESGFKVDNPNPLWTDPKAQAVQEAIDTQINPGVASHGGHVALLDVKDDIAYIALGGGCQGCGMADVTLKQGIEVLLKEAVPEIRQVIDTTDHAAGKNPFYQPSKGGTSPFA
ncbi:MAG: iron-sulfur cluster assembly accessory protein, partial [Candidatus Methylomirabilales bacterium]